MQTNPKIHFGREPGLYPPHRASLRYYPQMDNAMFESRFLHGDGRNSRRIAVRVAIEHNGQCDVRIAILALLNLGILLAQPKQNQKPGDEKPQKNISDATSAFSPPHRAQTRDYPPARVVEKLSASPVWAIIRQICRAILSATSGPFARYLYFSVADKSLSSCFIFLKPIFAVSSSKLYLLRKYRFTFIYVCINITT